MGDGVGRDETKPQYVDKLYKGGKWREIKEKSTNSSSKQQKFTLNEEKYKVLT
jgi:hypothetical protein